MVFMFLFSDGPDGSSDDGYPYSLKSCVDSCIHLPHRLGVSLCLHNAHRRCGIVLAVQQLAARDTFHHWYDNPCPADVLTHGDGPNLRIDLPPATKKTELAL